MHLLKGELRVMYVQQILVPCSSCKPSWVFATKPIQGLQATDLSEFQQLDCTMQVRMQKYLI